MIGLIPFLLDDFLARQCGPAARQELHASLSLPRDFAFSIAQSYDDAFCREVITAIAVRIALPFPVLYDRLGEHFLTWINQNLGGMFEGANDAASFLCRLPAIYNSFGGSAAGSLLPGVTDLVTVRKAGNRLRMTYQSQARFAEFFASFMKAVGRHFGQALVISVVAGDVESPFCVFDIEIPDPSQRASHRSSSRAAPDSAFSHAG